jgi:hypothetical protein
MAAEGAPAFGRYRGYIPTLLCAFGSETVMGDERL